MTGMRAERPLLIPFLALAGGLCTTDIYGILLPFSFAVAVLCCLVLSCFIRPRLPLDICTSVFFFVWGLSALTPWKNPQPSALAIQQHASRLPVIIEGIILSRPVATAIGGNFVLRSDRVFHEERALATSGNLLVHFSAGETELMRGDRVRLSTRITVPHRLGLPGEFDYPRFLAFREIAATGRVATTDEIVLIRGGEEDFLLRRIDLVSRRLGDFIRASLPDNAVSSVLTALLIGDQRRIPQQLTDAYTRAGVNHILSISGFHIGIIVVFMVQLAMLLATRWESLALCCNLRRSVLLLALPAMLMYLLLTGAAPATARAVIMLAVFVLALFVERESDPVNALLLAAMLLVTVNPPSLFDISFQLSFLALWGIVIAVPPAMAYFDRIEQGWLRTIIQFIVTSCAACCATAVPVLFTFHQASLNGVVSNFLIVPLLGYGAVLVGFCALPLVFIHAPAAHLLLWLAGKLVILSNNLVMLFSHLPLLRFNGITHLDMLLFLACMSVLTFLRSVRVKLALCFILTAVAFLSHLFPQTFADGRLHVTMLSVGQAESLLIRLPDGSIMLVDGGGYLHENGQDFGERILAPALHKLGVQRIDRMVMTHSHPDHDGGLPGVARIIPVGEFWEPAPGGSGSHYEQLRDILASQRVPLRTLAAGDEFTLAGEVSVKVLSPPATAPHHAGQASDREMNEDSLVFRLGYGSTSILLTADTGFLTEERLLRDGADLASTVLKIGHHGSRFSTSERFLQRVSPGVALISAARGNSFGLPAPQTIELLRKRGIRTYRTDRDGTIELVSDGAGWSVSTPYNPE